MENKKTMADYAIEAFHRGSDKFGETPTGTGKLYYNTMKFFGGQNPHYTMTVMLVQADGHPCTSGIGFYKKRNSLVPCSGHMLSWSIEITPEIQAELDNAQKIDF
jgi:hypothetical protein